LISSKRQKLLERDGQICVICKNHFELDNLTTDHIIPKSLGGSTDIVNQRLLCLKCHKAKNTLESKVKRLLGRAVFASDGEAGKELMELTLSLSILNLPCQK
jgi:5-methylcytosine-specific restriction endonuclease McrA